jgi:beta-phosphoglucomutase-like phosphatase (HAD superfamily)
VRVDPACCLVIEDPSTGARAGLAAGATAWGYCPADHGRAFDGLPVARVFRLMDELAGALGCGRGAGWRALCLSGTLFTKKISLN